MPFRGGWFIDVVRAGVFAFCLQHRRASSFDYLGVRAASFFLLITFGDRQKIAGARWRVV